MHPILQATAHLYPALLEQINASVVIYGPDGAVQYCNPQASLLTGWTPGDGRDPEAGSPWQLYGADGVPLAPEAFPVRVVLATRRPVQGVKVGLRRSGTGERVWGLVNAFPELAPDGRVLRVVATCVDISPRVEAESRLRIALDSGGMGVWDWEIPGNVLVWDDRMLQLYGLDRGTFPGGVEAWQRGVHPEDRAAAVEASAAALRGDAEYQTEFRILRPDGEVRHLRAAGLVIRDPAGHPLRMIGINWDITAQRQAERQVARLTGLLKAAQAMAQVGGWEIDLEAGTLHWTDETFRIHDLDPAEFSPTLEGAIGFYAPGSVPAIQGAVQDAIALGRPFDLELELITARQRRIWVQATGRAIQERGRTVRVEGVFRDITETRRMAEERRRLEAEIMHAQKLESLGALASGIAHDMNNVLAAILGLASAMQVKHEEDPDLVRTFATLERAATRGKELVAGLTNFSRKGLRTPQAMDLNELIESELELLRHTTLQRVEVVAVLARPLPRILGEREFLGAALMNLCVNALDGMPDGGILTLRSRRLDDDRIELEVADNGTGMAPEVLARALEPFFTTKPMGKGTGLGLSMVYGTMKAHGGSMEIDSQPGLGTRVRLRFPALDGGAGAAAPKAAPAADGGAALRILVVDDDELIRSTIPGMLEQLGHTVLTEASAMAGLACLEAGAAVDLVIMDHNMPGLSGAEAVPRILALRPALPILIATGFQDESLQKALRLHPAVAVLGKPFAFEALRARLEAFRTEGRLPS